MENLKYMPLTEWTKSYHHNGKYGANFVFDEPVSPEDHEKCVQAVLCDPARVVLGTMVAMLAAKADTPDNRALLRRYMVGLDLECPRDLLKVEADVHGWRMMLAGEIGRHPSDAEVAEAMLDTLRTVESDVLVQGGAK